MTQQTLTLCTVALALVVMEIAAAIARRNDRVEKQMIGSGKTQSTLQVLLPVYGAMLVLVLCVSIPTWLLQYLHPDKLTIVPTIALNFMAFTGGIVLGSRQFVTPAMMLLPVRANNKKR